MRIPTRTGWVIIGVIVVVFLIFSLYRSCDLGSDIAKLQGSYETLKAEKAKSDKVADSIIKAKTEENAKLTGEIAVIRAEAEKAKKEVEAAKSDVASAHTLSQKLRTGVEFTIAQNPKLKAFVLAMDMESAAKDQVINSQADMIAGRDAEIKQWELKSANYESIIIAWKGKYENSEQLRITGETLTKKLEQKLTRRNLIGSLKSGLILAAGAGLAYNLLRKK